MLDFPILYNGGENLEECSVLSSIPSGSGIYSVSNYSVNKKISLNVNKNHHSGYMPYIENININIAPDRKTAVSMLEAGQIDMISGSAIDLQNYTPARKLSYKELNDTEFVFVGINTNNAVTHSPDVRSFLAEEISKTDLSNVAYCKKASLPVHPDSASHIKIKKHDMSAWEDSNNNGLLDNQNDKEFSELSFELLVNNDNPQKLYLAEKIKASLIKSGINIKIRAFSFEKYTEKINSCDYELFLGETKLLPCFDTEDLKHFLAFSEYEDIPLGGLYFKNDVLLFSACLVIDKIQTLNPYKSIIYFELS